jgi:hypothetical protein
MDYAPDCHREWTSDPLKDQKTENVRGLIAVDSIILPSRVPTMQRAGRGGKHCLGGDHSVPLFSCQPKAKRRWKLHMTSSWAAVVEKVRLPQISAKPLIELRLRTAREHPAAPPQDVSAMRYPSGWSGHPWCRKSAGHRALVEHGGSRRALPLSAASCRWQHRRRNHRGKPSVRRVPLRGTGSGAGSPHPVRTAGCRRAAGAQPRR